MKLEIIEECLKSLCVERCAQRSKTKLCELNKYEIIPQHTLNFLEDCLNFINIKLF